VFRELISRVTDSEGGEEERRFQVVRQKEEEEGTIQKKWEERAE